MGKPNIRNSAAPVRIITYDARFYTQTVSLIAGIQQQELSGGVTLEEQHDLQDMVGTYFKRNGHFWLAMDDGKVIGTIGLIDLENDIGSLKKMFVDAPWRGREKGIAQTLLDHLWTWAVSHGFRHIYLGTGPSL